MAVDVPEYFLNRRSIPSIPCEYDAVVFIRSDASSFLMLTHQRGQWFDTWIETAQVWIACSRDRSQDVLAWIEELAPVWDDTPWNQQRR
jgi:hypothetical protein